MELPDWYVAACIRGLVDLAQQGANDDLLVRAARGYVAGRP